MNRVDDIIEATKEPEPEDETALVSPYDSMDDDELLEFAITQGVEVTDREGILAELDALDAAQVEEVA
jgi:hypothetical protein